MNSKEQHNQATPVMQKKSPRIVIVGAGNVGLHAVLTLALLLKSDGGTTPLSIYVVDFDTVTLSDSNKGYQQHMCGRFKVDALLELVKTIYGEKPLAYFHPVHSAAQSVPGLIREADAVLNGTDSTLDAGFVSEMARNTFEIRMSTGIVGATASHTIEILPGGYTLGDVSYDIAAFADATRYECQFGIPINSFSAVAQPFGSLTATLAIHFLLLHLHDEKILTEYRIVRVTGEKIIQAQGSPLRNSTLPTSQEIHLDCNSTLIRLFEEVARRLEVPAGDVMLEFPIPVVVRTCATTFAHGLYFGFERFPLKDQRCPVCGAKTYCERSSRVITIEHVAHIAEESLSRLNTPKGIGLTAWTRDSRSAYFHLPFRLDDIPALPNVREAPGK